MIDKNFRFPPRLGKAISQLPVLPPSFVLAKLLNTLLFQRPEYQNLQPLHGKLIAIRVLDIGLHFRFMLDAQGFHPAASDRQPDLNISASAYDFMQLVRRREDPDSLFFNRRLIIEGDTELGLVAKNTLDALDLTNLSLLKRLPAGLVPSWAKPF